MSAAHSLGLVAAAWCQPSVVHTSLDLADAVPGFCPATCSSLSNLSQQRAVCCNVTFETISLHAPTLVLLGLPLFHAEVVPVPLAFTGRMRFNTSLPLPLLRGSCFLLQLRENF